ncbi:MAG: glycoside hydrolase family 32 protein, partial [Terriglobia bacterium]
MAFLLVGGPAAGLAGDRPYDEAFRPQFHFSPPRNWMNDPNGLVYYRGEYHLFYQYNPFGDEWGNMSWGHAVSRDLVHWQNLPVAIPEQNGVMIFSGSAVVDWRNSSGLCETAAPHHRACLVAIYTGYNGKTQNQNLAYSNDRGRTWTQYRGNPVIDLHLANFRDPKVFWYKAGHEWVMVTVLATQHKVRFFASTDLKHWTTLSDFGPAGAVGGVWECPDLIELPVEGEPGQRRWVLSVNLNPGGVAGGSGDQYFVGHFDGKRFIDENPSTQALWADYGKDFYASTSFSNIPSSDGRRIMLGWMDDWQYAAQVPTYPWRGQMSIPRVVRLERFPEGIRMTESPVTELRQLRGHSFHFVKRTISGNSRFLESQGVRSDTFEIRADFDVGSATEFGFRIRQGPNDETLAGYDSTTHELFVDRTRSGATGFSKDFPGRQRAPLRPEQGSIRLHIFVDRCSVEVFGNGGRRVIT